MLVAAPAQQQVQRGRVGRPVGHQQLAQDVLLQEQVLGEQVLGEHGLLVLGRAEIVDLLIDQDGVGVIIDLVIHFLRDGTGEAFILLG